MFDKFFDLKKMVEEVVAKQPEKTSEPISLEKQIMAEKALEYFEENKIKCSNLSQLYLPIDWQLNLKLNALPTKNYGKKVRDKSSIRKIIIHWDAGLSSQNCVDVLSRRGLSTHFTIDNDGSIWQLVDTANQAFHAGDYNTHSIGIDLSNAYYLKYSEYYKKKYKQERPIISSVVHGDHETHLGYYPVQIDALKKLLDVICNAYEIPFACPLDKNGNLLTTVSSEAQKSSYKGVVCHYHVARNKIDCAGLELDKILNDLKSSK
jgi:hypothetical protein